LDGLKAYILCIGTAALIVGILAGFTDSKSSTGILTRMICGLFLTIVVINPVAGLDDSYLDVFSQRFDEAAQAAVAAGSEMADEARRELIKAETEAYILDKAGSYNVRLEVQVTLADGEVPLPESVCLSGKVSPYAKTCLQNLISDELGIPKERQLWIG